MYVPYITEYIVVSINTQNIMYMLTKPKKPLVPHKAVAEVSKIGNL